MENPKKLCNLKQYENLILKDHLDYIVKYEHFSKTVIATDKQPSNNQEPPPWLFIFVFINKFEKFPEELLIYYTGEFPYVFIGKIKILEMDNQGLTKLSIDELSENFEYSDDTDLTKQKQCLLKEAFFAIRELYHKHTHHINGNNLMDVPDSLTLPVYSSDKSEAVKEIIKYYQEKIIEYNNSICDIIIESHNIQKGNQLLYDSIELQKQAKGCFIYGKNFLEEYSDCLTVKELTYYKLMFDNATLAVQAFYDEINSVYKARNSELLQKLSKNSLLLATIIILFSILSLFSKVLFEDHEVYFVFMGFSLIFVFGKNKN